MRDWSKALRPASFRGVPFHVDYDDMSGGKRLAIHEMAGSYDGEIEEIGGATPTFSVTAYVIGDFSDLQAIALGAMLEKPGPGFLMLPIDGGMMATPERFYRTRSKRALGWVGFDISFRPHRKSGGAGLSLGNVDATAAAGQALAGAAFSALF